MNKPHVHAELIKAWADGVEIEEFLDGRWRPVGFFPSWNEKKQYRIKPPKKTPGQVYFEAAVPCGNWVFQGSSLHEIGARAVIEAYKQGMFDEDCNC